MPAPPSARAKATAKGSCHGVRALAVCALRDHPKGKGLLKDKHHHSAQVMTLGYATQGYFHFNREIIMLIIIK